MSYPEMVRLADREPVMVDTEPAAYRLDVKALAAAVTPRTKVIILNSPNNPTGVVYNEREVGEVAQLAVESDLPALAEAVAGLQSQCISGAPSISQRAALAALREDQAPLEEMRRQFDKRRRYVLELLAKMPGVRVDAVPEGAFYIFAKVSDLYGGRGAAPAIGGSLDFAQRLLEEARVAVVPGLPFGSDNHVRLAFSDSLERLAEGMDRLDSFLRSL